MVFLHSEEKGLIAEYGTNNSIHIVTLCYDIIKHHINILHYLILCLFIYVNSYIGCLFLRTIYCKLEYNKKITANFDQTKQLQEEADS